MQTYCGLDVHKDSVFMCIINEIGVVKEQKFTTLTSGLFELRSQLELYDVSQVAMESTSIYWIPIWRVLVDTFDLKLVNPLFIKQLPGRKTDVRDAHWIALVLMKGLVYGSYVPDHLTSSLHFSFTYNLVINNLLYFRFTLFWVNRYFFNYIRSYVYTQAKE